jgi:hypothetical protein
VATVFRAEISANINNFADVTGSLDLMVAVVTFWKLGFQPGGKHVVVYGVAY